MGVYQLYSPFHLFTVTFYAKRLHLLLMIGI